MNKPHCPYITVANEAIQAALDFQQNKTAITNSYEKISNQAESAAGSIKHNI